MERYVVHYFNTADEWDDCSEAQLERVFVEDMEEAFTLEAARAYRAAFQPHQRTCIMRVTKEIVEQ